MASWSNGYFAEAQYTGHYYPQLAPAFLSFACLRQGVRPPTLGPGSTYLELGCGQGTTVNVLAAANPEMHFFGVDFMPGQIANARRLAEAAGLANVTFEDASFQQMAEAPERHVPKCDIVVLHGILSWVADDSARAIVRILDAVVKPGGLVYVSYNALPGWYALQGLQQFIAGHAARGSGTAEARIVAALKAAEELSEHAQFFKSTPGLKRAIEEALTKPPSYLPHEYLNEGSRPRFHAEVVRELEPARLEYAGTASLADDILKAAAPAALHPAILSAPDPVWRETLLDYASNKIFRRDIFVRGRNALSAKERRELLGQVRLAKLPSTSTPGTYEFHVPLGRLSGDPHMYDPIMEGFAEGPRSCAEVLALPALAEASEAAVVQALGILVGARRLHPVREGVDPKPALALNRALVERSAYEEVAALAAPAMGAGVLVDAVDLAAIGAKFGGKKVQASPELAAPLKRFEAERAPLLKALGVF